MATQKRWSDEILQFFGTLKMDVLLPPGVEVLNPYQNPDTFGYCQAFYQKFYQDSSPRHFIMGINPGRFGAGLTGIPFTDPQKLSEEVGIPNKLAGRAELSADFVYRVIHKLGGPTAFYSRFYIGSVSPLGFTRGGKNMNYYDDKTLQSAIEPFAERCLKKQLTFGLKTDVVFVLGEGQNFKYVSALNARLKVFDKVVPLAHPRFIMQYKRKQVAEYVHTYARLLNAL